MKILNFEDLNELLKEIELDKNSTNKICKRFPIRFIFLPDFETVKDLYQHLTIKKNCSYFNLIDLLPHDDGWITPENIFNSIKNEINKNKNNDIVIIPLSEIIRFYSDKNLISIFFSLCSLENLPDTHERRIYIPIAGMHERFDKTIASNYSREWGPVWKLNPITNDKLEIYICSNQDLCKVSCLNNKNILNLNSTRKWLNLWKKDKKKLFNKNIVVHSKSLSKFYKYSKPDSFFFFNDIDNIKTIISFVHCINIPIEYDVTERGLWEDLDGIIRKKFSFPPKNFEHLITTLFNINRLEKKDFIKYWVHYDKKTYRWLLRNFILNNFNINDGYLIHVLENISSFDDDSFELELWTRIFKIPNRKNKIVNDRLELIREYYELSKGSKSKYEDIIKQHFEELNKNNISILEKLRLLTNLTNYEKKKIFELSIIGIKNNEFTREDLLDIYSSIYPSLYKYLTPISVDNDTEELKWINDYFTEYRWSKIFDEISKDLIKIISEKNHDEKSFYKWYHNIKTSYNYLNKDINQNEIIWIDALGFEWVSFIYHTISSPQLIKKIYISRSEIPTTTDCNRFPNIEKKNQIKEFDQLIHREQSYKHPDSFIREIETLEQIINDILKRNKDIVIVSDHGLSAFVRKKHGAIKKRHFEDSEHEGRCMWTDDEYPSDSDFISITSPEKFITQGKNILVAIKHDSLNELPRREVHGGATPEEIIVPYIQLGKKIEEIKYTIYPNEFNLTIGEEEVVSIIITPKPHEVFLLDEQKKKWPMLFDNENDKWNLRLNNFNTGSYKFCILIDNEERGEIKVNITGGMKVRDLL